MGGGTYLEDAEGQELHHATYCQLVLAQDGYLREDERGNNGDGQGNRPRKEDLDS